MYANPHTYAGGLLLCSLLLGAAPAVAELDKVAYSPRAAVTQGLRTTDNYNITSAPVESLKMDPPKLPDLSPYTLDAVLAKVGDKTPARIVLKRMLKQDPLKDFIGGDERMREWVARQRAMPQAIFIEGGFATPQDLAKALPARYFEEQEPGVFIARLPLVVGHGATLHIDSRTKDLRLSLERGSFLINDGRLFLTESRLTAWSEAKGEPAWWKKKGEFRPFFVAWGGTETYIADSTVTSLGYTASKSYGLTISQYTPGQVTKMGRSHPTGWVIDSVFDDMWYGFYCYEADDVVIKGNTYKNNIVYGIDPHDRSNRLLIADNEIYGTRMKHGLIISREVNDSWIFNNRSYDNELSGIVIDRSSSNNVIAYNESYDNRSDGITIYESGDNLLWGNKVIGNHRHGIRVRNSVDIKLYENLAASNGKIGIYGHIKDLSDTDRNIALDPFDTQVSLLVVGGKLIGNGSGPIGVDSPLSLELYKVEMLAPAKASGISLPGVLGRHQDRILDMLVRQQQAVLIDPIETQSELQD